MKHIPCPVESLRRLQLDFKQLADRGCDPLVAFVTMRRPVFEGDPEAPEEIPHEPYNNYAYRRYYNEVKRRGLYARDWGWELSGRIGDPVAWRYLNTAVGENWSHQLAGWAVDDGCTSIPACERWQYVFIKADEFPRFDLTCKRAATLFGNSYESPIVQWAFGPNRPNEAHPIGVPGLWCDLVLHVALQSIPGVMLSTIAVAMDEHLHPIRGMQPGDWTKPDQPPVWIAKVEHFSTASIDCIDAMIANWPTIKPQVQATEDQLSVAAPTEATFQQFHIAVKRVFEPLRTAISKIRFDAANSGNWLDAWQSFGLLVKDRWNETQRISNKARLYREFINANHDRQISIRYLDTPYPTWAIGDSNLQNKQFTAHQAVLAIAEKLDLDLSEMRRWNVDRTTEAERLSQVVALKAAFDDFDVDDIGIRLEVELKGTLEMPNAIHTPQRQLVVGLDAAAHWREIRDQFREIPTGPLPGISGNTEWTARRTRRTSDGYINWGLRDGGMRGAENKNQLQHVSLLAGESLLTHRPSDVDDGVLREPDAVKRWWAYLGVVHSKLMLTDNEVLLMEAASLTGEPHPIEVLEIPNVLAESKRVCDLIIQNFERLPLIEDYPDTLNGNLQFLEWVSKEVREQGEFLKNQEYERHVMKNKVEGMDALGRDRMYWGAALRRVQRMQSACPDEASKVECVLKTPLTLDNLEPLAIRLDGAIKLLRKAVEGTWLFEGNDIGEHTAKSPPTVMHKASATAALRTSKLPKPSELDEVTGPSGDSIGNEQGEAKRKRRRRNKSGHRRNSEELFRAALRRHHQYQTGGSILNPEPASTRQIEELAGSGVSDSTARRLLERHFGSVEQYREACRSRVIGQKLVVLLGDGLHAFGSFDTTKSDVEDAAGSTFDE